MESEIVLKSDIEKDGLGESEGDDVILKEPELLSELEGELVSV